MATPIFWSFLYPRSDDGKVYIIDWQGWRVDTATDDLAYMIALHWYPDRRHSLERDLLRRYHERLLTYGVKNYGWDECWYDYRLSVIGTLLVPEKNGGVLYSEDCPNIQATFCANTGSIFRPFAPDPALQRRYTDQCL